MSSETAYEVERSVDTITMKDGTRIYFKEWGSGQPVVFSHGWPLSADAWEDQMVFLASRGLWAISVSAKSMPFR